MSIISQIVVRSIPFIPKSVVGFFARPYIAGDALSDGVRIVKELNAKGIMATMDVLGESVNTREESIDMRRKCEDVLHAIDREHLDSNLSIKPTQMGLTIDTGFCEENLRVLLDLCRKYGNFVRIDMEDHPTTDATLAMYRRLRTEYPGMVGTVLQSYMRRSASDVASLMADGHTNLRLCKGIYVEPEAVAFKGREEVRDSFKSLNRTLLGGGAYVGIATHDDVLIEDGIALVKELKLDREKYEFQMLLGVRPQRRDSIVAQGHRMRVYVPFGDRWYAYSTRRLKENPNMAMHIVKAIVGLNK
ncbi:MAG: proline dehydrogenase family protein [Ignavibacteria bacterium]|nr:proline dehydrogenase family protein [Ignavibacteria bacterium]